ncbi:MAG TPA: hypothetical protein VGB69_00170 [Edaphobacter sp.]
MASTPTKLAIAPPEVSAPVGSTGLLIHLSVVSPEELEPTLSKLSSALQDQSVLVTVPEGISLESLQFPNLQLLPHTPAATSTTSWVLTAADYLNMHKLAVEHQASGCLLLGAGAFTLPSASLRSLAEATLSGSSDLVVAHYHPGPRESLVNSAILYPVTRALFCSRPRFPLAIDLGLSTRMAERLAASAQRFTAANQEESLLWPVAEAASAGFTSSEFDTPSRVLPQPAATDLNALFSNILGSFFNDIDLRAPFWQRMRAVIPPPQMVDLPSPPEPLDVAAMLESFHLAYSNLQEIWSLVLPPHTLLGLKHLSVMPPDSFRMPDSLWTRIVYDFILAYRLRTMNRGHLLGALTPLYLAWVASHLTLIQSGIAAERHIEDLALAFETDKPYLVSRWRWPDRFNP